jgi:hypothetical protein
MFEHIIVNIHWIFLHHHIPKIDLCQLMKWRKKTIWSMWKLKIELFSLIYLYIYKAQWTVLYCIYWFVFSIKTKIKTEWMNEWYSRDDYGSLRNVMF